MAYLDMPSVKYSQKKLDCNIFIINFALWLRRKKQKKRRSQVEKI